MTVDYDKRTLQNGLDVIVHEDHGCPIVAVNLWYHVGSKNERPDRTGFAHLFEHLMFEGSAHHDSGYFRPLQEIGGALNGSTSTDRTNYWEVVPTGGLDRALWLESDRMGFLLPALTQEKFSTQRDVVLNERRQNYENRPYGLVAMVLMAELFPPAHPYHWLPIGSAQDLLASTLDEVHEFFATYYHPANVSLAIAGDVVTSEAFERAQHYFGDIPAGPQPERPSADEPPERNHERRRVLTDRVELPRLYLAWRSPALFAAQDAELDLVGDILAGGKSSRLYRRLVLERRLATDVTASQSSREIAGTFSIVATAAPGHTLGELDAVVMDELQRLEAEGPTASEVERSCTRLEADYIFRLQSVGGFGGQADQLNAYNTYVGDPGYGVTDLARYRSVNPDRVKTAIRRWLASGERVALSAVPDECDPGIVLPGSVSVHPD